MFKSKLILQIVFSCLAATPATALIVSAATSFYFVGTAMVVEPNRCR